MKYLCGWMLFILVPCALAHEASGTLGRNLAATCANCHGTQGRSVGSVASLAGQPADDLITKLTQFKLGQRPATIMHQIAKGFSDEQINAIAAYFAAQRK